MLVCMYETDSGSKVCIWRITLRGECVDRPAGCSFAWKSDEGVEQVMRVHDIVLIYMCRVVS